MAVACNIIPEVHNKDTRYAIGYHEETKHSETKLRTSRHYLDWDNKPLAFKVYPDLTPTPLPRNVAKPESDALLCIRSTKPLLSRSDINTDVLAQILFFSAGVTREMKFDFGTYYMRAASATGALYPIELYVVCKDIEGLQAGVYHFCPGDFSLTKLRGGDYRAKLASMAGDNPDILYAPTTIVFTSLAWRNAWKYVARSYRHWFWDSGVIAANLLATAISAGLKPSLVMGFVDSGVNRLLCLEQRKEAAIVLAPLLATDKDGEIKPDPESVQDTANPRFLQLSEKEIEYPEIWDIHESSSLETIKQVKEWLSDARAGQQQKYVETNYSIADTMPQSGGLGDVILRRGSSRRFARTPIPLGHLLTILYSSTRGVPADFLKEGQNLVDIYLVANAVEGLTSGRYFYDRYSSSLKQLGAMREMESRNESQYLCLGQQLFGNASAVLFVMASLDAVLKVLGNRGYRACQFEAGVVAGKVYLSSYALGLGASGSTFFDDAVTESFSPHAKDKATMIALGVGVPAYKAKPGSVLPVRLTRSELALAR